MRTIPGTDLDVFPLCLGRQRLRLDGRRADVVRRARRYVERRRQLRRHGRRVRRGPEQGGESETIIGEWLAARGNRDRIVIATKVGMAPGSRGCGATTIRAAAEASLRAAADRPHRPLLRPPRRPGDAARGDARRRSTSSCATGKVRHVAASNYAAPRLAEALADRRARGLRALRRAPAALQPGRARRVRGRAAPTSARARALGCVPYFALAQRLPDRQVPAGRTAGGRARGPAGAPGLPRRPRASRCWRRSTRSPAAPARRVGAVALAWLAAQPTVVAPIASARTPEQLAELLPMADLALSPDELGRLDAASA